MPRCSETRFFVQKLRLLQLSSISKKKWSFCELKRKQEELPIIKIICYLVENHQEPIFQRSKVCNRKICFIFYVSLRQACSRSGKVKVIELKTLDENMMVLCSEFDDMLHNTMNI